MSSHCEARRGIDTLRHDPAFGGSFSIKRLLPALVPSLFLQAAKDRKGVVAAAELWGVMLGSLPAPEREYACDALFEYCQRNTNQWWRCCPKYVASSIMNSPLPTNR